MRALRLGITGKIASGKSTFADVARQDGIEVIETDSIAKELMVSDSSLRADLISILSPDAYNNDGTLNKAFIASKIFADEELRLKVEAVVHPAVMAEVDRRIELVKENSIVAVESAILVQCGYDERFDVLVMIWATDEAVIHRAVLRGGINKGDVLNRLKDQDYSDEIKGFADFIIDNDSTVDELIRRSKIVLSIIKSMAMSALPLQSLRSQDEPE